MALGTRMAATLVTVAVAALPAACGGDGGGGEGGGEGAMRATLTDDGCTYDGDTSPAAGMFTIEVENRTEFLGAFAVAALAGGSTIEDLERFVEPAQQQFEQDGTIQEPPDFYEQVVRSGIEPGATGALPADVPAGTYALMCFVDDLPTWRVYVAEQLEVTE